ncbi:MAG TPA: hypothetical protein VMZ25_08580 [Terriglobales bacterium]|nr:hypothetical protein [Terriglobales bacterium]
MQRHMKITMFVTVLFVATLVSAKDNRFYQTGLLAEMNATECGYHEKSGKGFVGSLIGTDSASKDIRQTLCQEYVLKSDKVTYRVRPHKEKKAVLLPIGERIEFRIKKDKMLMRVGDSDKEIEYDVVSMVAVEREASTKTVAEAK